MPYKSYVHVTMTCALKPPLVLFPFPSYKSQSSSFFPPQSIDLTSHSSMEDSRSTIRNPPPPLASLFADTAPAGAKMPNELSPSSSGEDAGRERLKRHRDEVAGKVKIPDKWGKEQMMKDWIEFSTFDALLGSHQMIIAARDALIADARKAKSPRLRMQRTC